MAILKIKDENGNIIEVPAIKGNDGVTPHIGENGNWYLGTTDTGVKAGGVDELAPVIVQYDEQGVQIHPSLQNIQKAVDEGRKVYLKHPDYGDQLFSLTMIDENYAWFSGPVADDLSIVRFEYDNNTIHVYDNMLADADQMGVLIVNTDEQMGQVSHTTEEIFNHYRFGGNVLLTIGESNSAYYQLIDATAEAAWFGGMVYDDGLGYRYLYTNDGVEEYESSWLSAYHNITGDHTHPNDVFYWDPDIQRTARGNLGLGEVIQINDDFSFVRVSGTEINLQANTDQRNGGGAYLMLGESSISMADDRVAEVIEFWGNDHDEEVVLRRVAPGIEDFDAATMGQLRDTQAIVDDMNQDVADALNAAIWAETQISTNLGPKMSQVQTGLGALSALFDPELIENGITAADEGKFLRVVNGKLTLVSIPNAEDGEF